MDILNLIEKICIPFCLLILTIWQCHIQNKNQKLEEKRFISEKKFKLFDKRFEFLENFKKLKYHLFLKISNKNDKDYEYLEKSITELYYIIKKSKYLFNYKNEKFFITNILTNIFELEEKQRKFLLNKDKNLKIEIESIKNALSNSCDKLINTFESYLILEDEEIYLKDKEKLN